MTNNIWAPAIIAVAISISGCASTMDVSDDTDISTVTNISWLEKRLQEKGVFISPDGPADLDVPAMSSTRLVLDGREILSVYEFDDLDLAWGQAYKFYNSNPADDVYLKESLVVVRRSRRDTGLSQTLRDILGEAL